MPKQIRFLGRSCAILAVFAALIADPPGLHGGRWIMDQTGRRVNVPEHPERLVSLAPSITETLYALGLGERLVGVTDYCDYPPEAKKKPHIGGIVNPSLEKIVALKPDLVLGSADANRREVARQLERLGIPLYGLRARGVEELLHSIEDLSQVLDEEEQARRLVADLRRRVECVEKRVRGRPPRTVLFIVSFHPLIVAGFRTFISDVIRRAGGLPVIEEHAQEWPRLVEEEAVHLDPDVILIPRSEGASLDLNFFERQPGWMKLRAVQERRVFLVSDTITHPSPRLMDALEEVSRILHPPRGLVP